jgi:transcriptional regulator with XRE-family HTH domain
MGTVTERSATGEGRELDPVLAQVGPRLRRVRQQRGATLAGLAGATGISVSTLSRLESGLRRPSLELLLPIARAHRVPLDELVGAPAVEDPRVRTTPVKLREGVTMLPLTAQPGGAQAYKMTFSGADVLAEPQTHAGYEWIYVLRGKLRLVLAEHDIVMGPGEAAEFDTRLPHAFGSAGGVAEVISIFGRQGERIHLRTRSQAGRSNPGEAD